MATGSKGTSGKGSSASRHSSAIVFLTILLFIMKDSAFDGIIGLVLFATVIMWIVQAQKDKKKRKTGWDYEHESGSDDQELRILSPGSLGQKKVIARRPHTSAKVTDPLSDLSADKLLSDSFTALTDALSGISDDSEKHDEPARPHPHQTLPTPSYSQCSSPPAPDSGEDVPESSGIDNYEPLPSEVAAPRFDAASLPAPDAPSALLVQGAHPSTSPKTSSNPRKTSSTAGTKSPSSLGTAKLVKDRRFDDMHRGSAAISMTRESSTMPLHDASEDHGSCLSASSLFSQD